MLYNRKLNLNSLLKNKSFFLFGARSTGKTTLIQQNLKNYKLYDLLDSQTYRRLLKRPKLLEEENTKHNLIVIDEIQKQALLLDEVHRLIQTKNYRFLLTGSSARKLKKGQSNLLAGRAWQAELFPLSWVEIPRFDLIKYLNLGGLPMVYNSKNYKEELDSYVSLYLREEIQNEALSRNIQAFAEFLDLIALSNGEEINYESFSKDLQVSPSTLKNYIEVLSDTLLGFRLPGWTKTKKRKAISRGKFYLFDLGVTNTLCHRGFIESKSELFGKAFEHFIILEMRSYLSYFRKKLNMNYWRSNSQTEVDLLVGDKVAIEIKSNSLIQDKHLKGLRRLKEEQLLKKYIVVSLDKEERITKDKIYIMPWKAFLKKLWQGAII
ncbi:MAG: ATP-binding protein [Bdellovibrionales bacterium]|nr:ATP-binding protein [Bdellovibrionales bacterium]